MKKLKNVRLSRAEYLDKETRKKHNLPDEGLIAMETWEVDNKLPPNPRTRGVSVDGGFAKVEDFLRELVSNEGEVKISSGRGFILIRDETTENFDDEGFLVFDRKELQKRYEEMVRK